MFAWASAGQLVLVGSLTDNPVLMIRGSTSGAASHLVGGPKQAAFVGAGLSAVVGAVLFL